MQTTCRNSLRSVAIAIVTCAVGCTEADPDLATARDEVVATPLTYQGWDWWFHTCTSPQQAVVYEPAAPGAYPVFVYAIGTGAAVTTAEGDLAAREMAARGFVAAVVSYNTYAGWGCADMNAKAACTFGGPRSAVAALCARGKADCDRGIVVGGLSQGASLALLGANHEPRIRAAWLMGFGGGEAGSAATGCYVDAATKLAGDRIRVVDGIGETSPLRNLNAALGTWCGPFATSCLRANGSGWIRVRHAEVEDGRADHCYFVGPNAAGGEVGCTREIPRFDRGWAPPADAPWSLPTNLDWLAGFAD